MKKLILIIATVAISHSMGFAQSCLPEGITFTTQAQIDSFQINNPNCTEIEGDVLIEGPGITNLNGLDCLTAIGGNLTIVNNDSLESLTGLENLNSIMGYLVIGGNPGYPGYIGNPLLTNLTGIDNLVYVYGIRLLFCSLESLTGLESLTSVGGGGFSIYGNSLINLSGLDNLISIDGDFYIGSAYSGGGGIPNLINLQGLYNLTSIGGDLRIMNNGSLTSLSGFGEVAVDGGIWITSNEVLENLQGLEEISNIGGDICIETNNAITNLQGLEELNFGGGIHICFNSQLSSLTGLEAVSNVVGVISIVANDLLTSLTELENITNVGGLCIAGNDQLSNLSGLENLTTIGGSLTIGSYHIFNLPNLSLNNISALANLNSVGENLQIANNPVLTDLSGLENITNIGQDLTIYYNPLLSACEIESICNYLATPNGEATIHSNAPGCNSPEEVEEACETVGLEEPFAESPCLIFPNPFTDMLTLGCSGITDNIELIEIYNTFGAKVAAYQINQTNSEITLNVKVLPPGLYFLRLQAGNEVRTGKVIKH